MLATIEQVHSVRPHPNADRLDLIGVLGFQLVTQKGLYQDGDWVVYIQPDSILPEADWAASFRVYAPSRIRAIKLRSEFSEGIVVPISVFGFEPELGREVSEQIGVTKYEAPAPNCLEARGNLPFGIPKTDETRWENMRDREQLIGKRAIWTRKNDGQSCSFYYHLPSDTFGVLGRTLDLRLDVPNNYTAHISRYNIEEKLRAFCQANQVSLCIRGESTGPNIQKFEKNQDCKKPACWSMFSVYNIGEGKYERLGSPLFSTEVARALDLPHVEILEDKPIDKETILRYSSELSELNGKSFEGIVVQYDAASFKVINKTYDSKK